MSLWKPKNGEKYYCVSVEDVAYIYYESQQGNIIQFVEQLANAVKGVKQKCCLYQECLLVRLLELW